MMRNTDLINWTLNILAGGFQTLLLEWILRNSINTLQCLSLLEVLLCIVFLIMYADVAQVSNYRLHLFTLLIRKYTFALNILYFWILKATGIIIRIVAVWALLVDDIVAIVSSAYRLSHYLIVGFIQHIAFWGLHS